MAGLPSRTRSFTLVQVELANAQTAFVYQSPADRITLVKTWTVHNNTAASVTVTVGVRPVDPHLAFWWRSDVMLAGTIATFESWFVLEPLDELVVATTGGPVRFAAYGTSLRA